MTLQQILERLDEILVTPSGDPKTILREDLEKLFDDLERELTFFPKEKP